MILVGFAMSGINSAILPSIGEYDEDKIMTISGELNWEYLILGENPELAIATMVIIITTAIDSSNSIFSDWSCDPPNENFNSSLFTDVVSPKMYLP